jgi:hypothetical protein
MTGTALGSRIATRRATTDRIGNSSGQVRVGGSIWGYSFRKEGERGEQWGSNCFAAGKAHLGVYCRPIPFPIPQILSVVLGPRLTHVFTRHQRSPNPARS